MKIDPDETKIRGSWSRSGREVVADEACRRIDQLVSSYLEKVGAMRPDGTRSSAIPPTAATGSSSTLSPIVTAVGRPSCGT
jgi:hypothetical protein